MADMRKLIGLEQINKRTINFINNYISRSREGGAEKLAEMTNYSIFVNIYTIENTPHPFLVTASVV